MRNWEVILAVTIGFLLLGVAVACGSFQYIQPGHVGVRVSIMSGTDTTRTYPEGMNFKVPFVDSIYPLSTQTRVLTVAASASSKDMQEVTTGVALNYSLNGGEVALLFKEIGKNWEPTIIEPCIQESVKAVTAKYTAEQIIHNRASVKDEIASAVKSYIEGKHLIFVNLSLVNFEFSDAYTHAIEQKQVAEQKALEAEQRKKQVITEAEATKQSKLLEAEGQQQQRRLLADAELYEAQQRAEANRVLQAAITPELLQLKALEKWSGVLPTVTSGNSVPFIQLQTSAAGK